MVINECRINLFFSLCASGLDRCVCGSRSNTSCDPESGAITNQLKRGWCVWVSVSSCLCWALISSSLVGEQSLTSWYMNYSLVAAICKDTFYLVCHKSIISLNLLDCLWSGKGRQSTKTIWNHMCSRDDLQIHAWDQMAADNLKKTNQFLILKLLLQSMHESNINS